MRLPSLHVYIYILYIQRRRYIASIYISVVVVVAAASLVFIPPPERAVPQVEIVASRSRAVYLHCETRFSAGIYFVIVFSFFDSSARTTRVQCERLIYIIPLYCLAAIIAEKNSRKACNAQQMTLSVRWEGCFSTMGTLPSRVSIFCIFVRL